MGAETELPWITSYASEQKTVPEHGGENEFPVGLRVLVVDDDRICLLILDRMLRQCLYKVTTCERAVDALKILRENKDGFDVVISDVHMPDMDGFKLLELVGLEMDLPVIMMSANGETKAVMKGISHGACDYLLKPVRIEELKNIWQHVIRRKQKDLDNFDDRHRTDDGGDAPASDGAEEPLKSTKKRKDNQEDDDDIELDNEDPATSKKPRVVWTVELHQKFVNAVNQLGISKAVPKRILELMDVRTLTRENVASHLQKFRLYLKRLSDAEQQPGGGQGVGLFGADERFMSTGGSLSDFRTHLSPLALIPSLHGGLLERIRHNNPDPYFLGQVPMVHGINNGSTGGPPYVTNANVLNSVISSGSDFKHLGHGIGQLASFGHSDKVPGLPLSAGSTLIGHNNQLQADHDNSLLMQMLQQQSRSQVASGICLETPIAAQKNSSNEVGSNLSKITSSVNVLGSFCRPGEDAATLTGYGVAAYRKPKEVDTKPLNHMLQVGLNNYSTPLRLPSQPIRSGNEVSGMLSGNGGLLCNPNEGRSQGLQPILTDQVSGIAASQLGAGLSNWQGWHSSGPNEEVGGQHGVPFVNSIYNQKLAPGQTAKMGSMPQEKLWIPKFQSELVEDVDTKPLVTSRIALFEQGLAEGDNLQTPRIDVFVGSKMGGVLESSFSSDDLLSSFIKQIASRAFCRGVYQKENYSKSRVPATNVALEALSYTQEVLGTCTSGNEQQEMMYLTQGDATTEDYTVGNRYVK